MRKPSPNELMKSIFRTMIAKAYTDRVINRWAWDKMYANRDKLFDAMRELLNGMSHPRITTRRVGEMHRFSIRSGNHEHVYITRREWVGRRKEWRFWAVTYDVTGEKRKEISSTCNPMDIWLQCLVGDVVTALLVSVRTDNINELLVSVLLSK